jgi:pimeloyl-ACP methyl ester carboxylesterase
MRVSTLAGALLAATSPAIAKEPTRFSVTVIGSLHFIMIDQPARFAREVERFLSR